MRRNDTAISFFQVHLEHPNVLLLRFWLLIILSTHIETTFRHLVIVFLVFLRHKLDRIVETDLPHPFRILGAQRRYHAIVYFLAFFGSFLVADQDPCAVAFTIMRQVAWHMSPASLNFVVGCLRLSSTGRQVALKSFQELHIQRPVASPLGRRLLSAFGIHAPLILDEIEKFG